MKRYLYSLLFCLGTVQFGFAQAPFQFNYQAVARKVDGSFMANTPVSVSITLTDGTNTYSETHSPTTNQYGLFNLVIGAGNKTSVTSISGLNWKGGNVNITLSVNGNQIGNTQLLSVPYALYANTSGNATSGTTKGRYFTSGKGIKIDSSGNAVTITNTAVLDSAKYLKETNQVLGDVTGTYKTLSVDKIKGKVVDTVGLGSNTNKILLYNGTVWKVADLPSGTGSSVTVGSGLKKSGDKITLQFDNTLDTLNGRLRVKRNRLDSLDLTNNNGKVIKVVNGKFELASDSVGADSILYSRIQRSGVKNGQVLKLVNGIWVPSDDQVGVAGGGIKKINGDSLSAQTISIDTTVSKIGIVDDLAGSHKIGIPVMGNTKTDAGLLSRKDYDRFSATNSDTSKWDLNANGIDYTGGNVGIGTTSPTQLLDIAKTGGDNYIRIQAGGNGLTGDKFSGVLLHEDASEFGWATRMNANTDWLYFSRQDGTKFSNSLTLKNTGAVLIDSLYKAQSATGRKMVTVGPDGLLGSEPVPTGGTGQWTDVSNGINYTKATGNSTVSIGGTSSRGILISDSANVKKLESNQFKSAFGEIGSIMTQDIKITSPSGGFFFAKGAGEGKVLTSDATGNASWKLLDSTNVSTNLLKKLPGMKTGQVIKWNGSAYDTLSIPAGSGTDSQILTYIPLGKKLRISNGNIIDLPIDTSSTNELQTLSLLNGDSLIISGGGTGVKLPLGTVAQQLTLSANKDTLKLTNAGKVILPKELPAANPGQILKYKNGKWEAANDSSIYATNGGMKYKIGKGLNLLPDSTIEADSNKAIWNANKILGKPVSGKFLNNGYLQLKNTANGDSIVFVPAPSGTSQWTNYTGAGLSTNGGIEYSGEVYIDDTLDVLNVIKAPQIRATSLNASEDITGSRYTVNDSLVSLGLINTPKLRISGGNPVLGQVLTAADNKGNVKWTTPTGGTPYSAGNNIDIKSDNTIRLKTYLDSANFINSQGDFQLLDGDFSRLYIEKNATRNTEIFGDHILFQGLGGTDVVNVGIGKVSTPLSKLHVSGYIRSDSLVGTDSSYVGVGPNGVLVRRKLASNGTTYLKGTGIKNLNSNRINVDSIKPIWNAGYLGSKLVDTANIRLLNNDFTNINKVLKWNGTKWVAGNDSTGQWQNVQGAILYPGKVISNSLVISDSLDAQKITAFKLIGTDVLANSLTVSGSFFRYKTGDEDIGKVLVSDVNGTGSWAKIDTSYLKPGKNGTVLTTDGTGKVIWATPSGGTPYTSGKGILPIGVGNVINAAKDSSIWNANRIMGYKITGTPSTGSVLRFKNGQLQFLIDSTSASGAYTAGNGIKINGNGKISVKSVIDSVNAITSISTQALSLIQGANQVLTASPSGSVSLNGDILNFADFSGKQQLTAIGQKVGIGNVSSPLNTLHVGGRVRIDTLYNEASPATRKMVTVDANGLLHSEAVPSGTGAALVQGRNIQISGNKINLKTVLDSINILKGITGKDLYIQPAANKNIFLDTTGYSNVGIGFKSPSEKLHVISSLGLGTPGPTGNDGSVVFYNNANLNRVTIQSGISTAAAIYTLPVSPPTANGQVLSSTTSGTMSWVSSGSSYTIGSGLEQVGANRLRLKFNNARFDTTTTVNTLDIKKKGIDSTLLAFDVIDSSRVRNGYIGYSDLSNAGADIGEVLTYTASGWKPSGGGVANIWQKTATNVYLATSTDKVGIGISTPSTNATKLHVLSPATTGATQTNVLIGDDIVASKPLGLQVLTIGNVSGTAGLILGSSSTNFGFVSWNNTTSSLEFGTNNTLTQPIVLGGNSSKIGIGLSSVPSHTLTVGASSDSNNVRFSSYARLGKKQLLYVDPNGVVRDTSFIAVLGASNAWQIGGNSFGATPLIQKIGATSSNALQLITNNQERLTISPVGDFSFNASSYSVTSTNYSLQIGATTAIIANTAGLVGIGGLSQIGYALTVNGDMKVTGLINSSNITETSDARYKTNVATIGNALATVQQLRGVSYDWKRNEFPDMNFKQGKDLGLIAQEVEKVLPELVNTDAKGFKSVQYSHLVSVLVEAIKEQQKQIEALKAQVSEKDSKVQNSENRIKTLESSVNTLNTQMQLLLELVGKNEGVKAESGR